MYLLCSSVVIKVRPVAPAYCQMLLTSNMVILFTLNPSGENIQVWTDLECSMGYKGKGKQLAFTLLITKLGESLCSYV